MAVTFYAFVLVGGAVGGAGTTQHATNLRKRWDRGDGHLAILIVEKSRAGVITAGVLAGAAANHRVACNGQRAVLGEIRCPVRSKTAIRAVEVIEGYLGRQAQDGQRRIQAVAKSDV